LSPDFSALWEIEEEILRNSWNARLFAHEVGLGFASSRLFDSNFVKKFTVWILDCKSVSKK
jgi:hypothetical protein